MRTSFKYLGAGIAVGALVLTSACGGPPSKSSGTSTSKAATATSAADFGGMDALVAAAKKEGTLNVIALPPTWANYGELISSFTAKYGIKINSANPNGTSADEVNAIKSLKGTTRAPDVVDTGAAVTLANTALFAPYKVATWGDIPDSQKESTGLWANDYGGYMSIGYDKSKVPAITSFDQLKGKAFKNKVALNGDPTQANAALVGVLAASVANGGSVSDISKGVDYFAGLKKSGNLLSVDPDPATIKSGQTPVVFDWDYNNAAATADLPTWTTVIPAGTVVASYYNQAINKQAPHPAAARLWEEYLYSDAGQNLYLKGLARPVREAAMDKSGTIDATLEAKLPKVSGDVVIPSDDDLTKAGTYLSANWSKAVS